MHKSWHPDAGLTVFWFQPDRKAASSISAEDAIKFHDALTNDAEFRRSIIEIVQWMKEGMDEDRSNIESVLRQLQKLG